MECKTTRGCGSAIWPQLATPVSPAVLQKGDLRLHTRFPLPFYSHLSTHTFHADTLAASSNLQSNIKSPATASGGSSNMATTQGGEHFRGRPLTAPSGKRDLRDADLDSAGDRAKSRRTTPTPGAGHVSGSSGHSARSFRSKPVDIIDLTGYAFRTPQTWRIFLRGTQGRCRRGCLLCFTTTCSGQATRTRERRSTYGHEAFQQPVVRAFLNGHAIAVQSRFCSGICLFQIHKNRALKRDPPD